MKRKGLYLFFIALCGFSNISAQQSGRAAQPPREESPNVYSIPSEIGLSVTAHQPDSPLQFEKAVLLIGPGANGVGGYKVRNRDTRPITGYTVALWTSGNTKSVWKYRAKSLKEWIMPGQSVTSEHSLPLAEITPVSNDLRAQMNLNGPMRGLGVFLVVEVIFSDGPSYSDRATFVALQDYMERLSQQTKAQK